MAQAELSNSSKMQSDDASFTIKIISRVLSVAVNWVKPGYGPYLIQNCALKVILNTLYTSPECLDGVEWPKVANFRISEIRDNL